MGLTKLQKQEINDNIRETLLTPQGSDPNKDVDQPIGQLTPRLEEQDKVSANVQFLREFFGAIAEFNSWRSWETGRYYDILYTIRTNITGESDTAL